MTIFAPAARRGLFVDWAFFDGSEISSEFVGGQCASWRFPPKAAVSACSRHSFVEGIRNGGLDVTQNRRSTWKIHFGRTKLPALQRFFSFPVLRGRIAWLIRFIPVRMPLDCKSYTAQPRLSCWIWNSLWYNPFFFISSSWVPCSTNRPLSRTRIWSASTTVRSR